MGKHDKHYTFAEKLRDALRHSDTNYTESTDDSYAVDISISGSKTDADEGIRLAFDFNLTINKSQQMLSLKLTFNKNERIKRGGSRGFVLTDDSLDEGFYVESLNQGQNWLEKYEKKFSNGNAYRIFIPSSIKHDFCLLIHVKTFANIHS